MRLERTGARARLSFPERTAQWPGFFFWSDSRIASGPAEVLCYIEVYSLDISPRVT